MKRRLVRALGALVGLLALWFGGGHLAAALYGNYALRSWEESQGPIAAIEGRYPKTPDDAAAVELTRRAAALGIDLANPPSSPPLELRVSGVDRLVDGLLGEQPADLEVEASVTEALAQLSPAVEAVRTHLLAAGEVRWLTDISLGYEAPIPRMQPIRMLSEVLLADALLADRRGDPATAEQGLLAAWKLIDSLRSRGELISQMMALDRGVRILRAVQRVSSPGAGWQERTAEYDAREGLVRAVQLESWLWRKIGADVGIDSFSWGHSLALAAGDSEDYRSPAVRWLADPLTRPYFLMCGSNTMLAGARLVQSLRETDACQATAEVPLVEPSVPWWNALGRIVIPRLSRAWLAAVRHALTAELTREVLGARAHRESEGLWPGAAIRPSAVCASWRWVSELSDEGEYSIRLDGVPNDEEPWQGLSFSAGPDEPAS